MTTIFILSLPIVIVLVLVVVGIVSLKKARGTKDKSSNEHPTNW